MITETYEGRQYRTTDPMIDGETEMIDGNGGPHHGRGPQFEVEHRRVEIRGSSPNLLTLIVHEETHGMVLRLQDRTSLIPLESAEEDSEAEAISEVTSEDVVIQQRIEMHSTAEADHVAHDVIVLSTR
jgi:hypothetical protein